MVDTRILFGAMIALAVEAGALTAATTIYTDRAEFDLATGGNLNFEGFSDDTFENFSIQTDAGFVTTGFFRDRPTPDTFFGAGDETTYIFDTATTAFGGDFDTLPNGNGNGLRFTLSTGEVVSEEISAPFTGFFGFVSDTSFTSVLVEAGSGPGRAETHNFDNFSFGVAVPIAPIPLPAGLPLLLSGLLGFFGLQKWSRRKSAT